MLDVTDAPDPAAVPLGLVREVVGDHVVGDDGLAVAHDVEGVAIPFASPRLLWRMKAITYREKDVGDLVFLRHWFAARGEVPPAV